MCPLCISLVLILYFGIHIYILQSFYRTLVPLTDALPLSDNECYVHFTVNSRSAYMDAAH